MTPFEQAMQQAAAIADVAPEELKMAGKEGASAAKAKGLVK